jgi:hypothetical protein
MPRKPTSPATPPAIDSVIRAIRGERVILDADLAKIYGVATKVFNQAVKRNREKFSANFLFELTREETPNPQKSSNEQDVVLRSQIVTLNRSRFLTPSQLVTT